MRARANTDSVVHRLLAFFRVVLVALWTVLWITLALMIHLVTQSHGMPLALAHRVWAPGVLRMIGARLEIKGVAELDFSRPYLFVANHTSLLDIPVLFASLPVPLRFLAKEELRRIPLVGHFIVAMGMVFIDRGQSAAARQSIDRMAAALAEGVSLVAFPEGTRSRDGELRAFKTGAFVAAIKSGVPVVPIHIDGASAILPAESLSIRPGPLGVAVGPPIPSQHRSLEDRRQFADLVRSRMVELDSGPESQVRRRLP